MVPALKRERVHGYLDTKGTKIVNGRGEEIILSGWGLGNWLLCEGYMWLANGAGRLDRPRRIEEVVRELAGEEYAQVFWKKFRENYITEADIARMAQMGYNSVRIPINSRLFLEEGPGLVWINEGFVLLDRCINWCEKHGLYAFIDLHGAPGGQTGANIDDSIDDIPRLFIDQDCFDKGIALWKKIATRYKDRWIVGGYDLLNEPLRPARHEDDRDTAYLLPRLMEFYTQAIQAIRKVDEQHLISLEGHHWSTENDVFTHKYDDKMIIHFHRYACLPELASYEKYLEVSKRLDSPLWLGETGENVHEWFAAMYPLSADLGIGYNLWPWKKMDCSNSPCSIQPPAGWEKLIDYAKGGPHPGYTFAIRVLDQFIEGMKIANCTINEHLQSAVFRTPGTVIRATDFDEFPGRGVSYGCERPVQNPFGYRANTGMEIVERNPDMQAEFFFDCRWRRFVLGLEAGDFACYTLNDVDVQSKVEIYCHCEKAAKVSVYQDDELLGSFSLGGLNEMLTIGGLRLKKAERSSIKVEVASGRIELDSISTSEGLAL